MARAKSDPSERLKLLLARREDAEDGDVLNAEGIARVVGITWRNLKVQIDLDPDFPVLKRGAEGTAWEFSVRAVLDHMIQRCREKIEAREKIETRKARLAGGIGQHDLPEGMTLADLAEINRIQNDLHRRKMEQRELVKRDEVVDVLTTAFGMVQQEVMSMVSRNDPAGRWPKEARAAIGEDLRGMLVRIHDRFGGWLRQDARGMQPDRAGSGTSRRRPPSAKRTGRRA